MLACVEVRRKLKELRYDAHAERDAGMCRSEREAERIRSKEGIPLVEPVIEELNDISAKTGIPFD